MTHALPVPEWIGLAVVAATFVAMALVERIVPRRGLTQPRARRWTTNLALFAIDTALVRIAIPLLMVGTALLAAERGWGVLNLVALPGWARFVLALLALDLALYFQHWATHRVPLLWRMHRVHHSDPDFDVTTAARFHPAEIAASMLYKMAVVALLGAPPLAVFVFEAAFTAVTIVVHANVSLPRRLERPVRALLVTPDMHRIHHSTRESETNSNYGTVLSGWDRLFGTYVDRPQEGQDAMTIGLAQYRDASPLSLGWSLLLPLRK